MSTRDDAEAFALEWVEAWNARDLERVLQHYTDDFEMSSPLIVSFTGESSGVLRGKENVRAYWKMALERIPDLRFEVREVFVGANSISLLYQAIEGKMAVEVFFLNEEQQVYKAFAHYDR